MKTAGVAKLKASLSEYLTSVKAGEQVVVTERGRPIAMIVPIAPTISQDEHRAKLIAQGLLRPGKGPIPLELIKKMRVPGLTREQALRAVEEGREDRI